MGHVVLTTPVTNILLFKSLAVNLSKVLEISAKDLEAIIYFRAFVVIDNGRTELLKKKEVLELEKEIGRFSDILQEIIDDYETTNNQERSNKTTQEYNEKHLTETINQAQGLRKDLQDSISEKNSESKPIIFYEDYL